MKKAQEKVASFITGIVFLAILLIVALALPNPTAFQYTIIRIVLALAGALTAVLLTGFLTVELGGALKAGGALAVFVVIYFYSPAGLVTSVQEEPSVSLSRVEAHRLQDGATAESTLDMTFAVDHAPDGAHVRVEISRDAAFAQPVSEEIAHPETGRFVTKIPFPDRVVFVRLLMSRPGADPIHTDSHRVEVKE